MRLTEYEAIKFAIKTGKRLTIEGSNDGISAAEAMTMRVEELCKVSLELPSGHCDDCGKEVPEVDLHEVTKLVCTECHGGE